MDDSIQKEPKPLFHVIDIHIPFFIILKIHFTKIKKNYKLYK